MMHAKQPTTMKRSLQGRSGTPRGVAPLGRPTQHVVVRAQKQDDRAAETGRRDVLGLFGLLAGLSAAQAAKAGDAYEEMKALSAARAGLQPSASLLESFEGTKGALSSGKTSRGIREKLASEAAPAAKSGGLFGSNTPKLASPVAAAPRPSMFSASAPKPSAPKPAAPKPAATAAAGGSSGGSIVSGPLIQAVGVLGLVGVGASVASNAATSKPKNKPATAAGSAQPSRAATPAAGTGKVKAAAAAPSRSATGKVLAGAAAAAAKSSTGKVSAARSSTPVADKSATGKVFAARSSTPATGKVSAARSSTPVANKSATGKVTASRPGTPSLRSATGKVKAGAAAAAASGSTVKTAIKQALVNEESPDEPTDIATGGFLGAVGLFAAFLLFSLPKPQVVAPTTTTVDPLVEEARQAVVVGPQSYKSPLFKSAGEAAPERKAISVAPALKAEAPKALKAPVVPLLPPKPAVVEEAPKPAVPVFKAEAPKPAAVAEAPKPAAPAAVAEAPKPAAPVLKAETAKPAAPKAVAEAPKPAAPVFKAETAKPAPKAAAPAAAPAAPAAATAQEGEGASAAQNLLVLAGGISVVVTAFALTGGSSDSSSSAEGGATGTPAAAGAGDSTAAATAAVASAAESVSAAASAAAAAAPAEGAQQGNAAYDKAVLALMSDPEVAEDLFSVMSPGEASQRNIPALAWSLISTPSNAERLDGFAFQKLSTQRYERVRQVLLDAGLKLPDTPKVQAGAAATLAPAGDVDSSEVDPEKLRGVFEALLANPASRSLMRQLLKGAGMPFNEEAFEEQVKDSNYFTLAIAPILRSMPQQKLRVLAELQDREKLDQLVSSVSTLAQNDQQMQAVTAELSSDVKQTVNTIREAEERAASGTGAGSS